LVTHRVRATAKHASDLRVAPAGTNQVNLSVPAFCDLLLELPDEKLVEASQTTDPEKSLRGRDQSLETIHGNTEPVNLKAPKPKAGIAALLSRWLES